MATTMSCPCSHSPQSRTDPYLPKGHPTPLLPAAVGTYTSYIKATTCL